MNHLDIPQLLGLLVLILGSAKLFGFLAKQIGQPAVLGELVAGVVLGTSVLGLVGLENEVLYFLAELGVILLLFEIGLETDLGKLIQVGGTSTTVAVAGVVLPFAGGYAVCWLLGLDTLVSIVAGATLTATSVGITARVLADLGRLQEPESQIVVGAAVIDDILGLIILAVVAGLTEGQTVTILGVAKITGIAFGFLAATLLLGSLVVPAVVRWFSRTLAPWNPTQKLVVQGVYRHVRNPMITGVSCILLGEAIFFGSPWLLGWFGLFVLVNMLYIPLGEEPGLAKRFGEDYLVYKQNVPRWIPRLRPWKDLSK
jgi:Kef-type K+ transport system membrane component KefB